MKNLIDITIFLLLQYLFTTLVLIVLYQGGSYFHPENNTYVLYQNYLSDLGRAYYFNGKENLFWSLYSGTLFLVAIGIMLFFYLMSKMLSIKNKLPFFFGILSGLGYIGVTVFLVDKDLALHVFFGRVAYSSFLLGTLTSMIYWKKQHYPEIYFWLMMLNIFLFGYLIMLFILPPSFENEFFLTLRTVSQKIIVFIQIIITSIILFKLRKYYKV
jgi:hypothetical protein